MRHFNKALIGALLSIAALSASTTTRAAPAVGVTISNDGMVLSTGDFNLGYSFIANNATKVVSLGIWDDQGNGLLNGHQVGLWDGGGHLLASTFVGAGTAGILDAGFRFTDIAPVALTAGQTYYVAAAFFTGFADDPWTADPSSMATAADITYDSRRYQVGSALLFPNLAGFASTGYWGGNVRLDANAVPEPGTLAILGLGLVGLSASRRRWR